MGWVDGARTLRVLTNCDTPTDAAEVSRSAGCGGLGGDGCRCWLVRVVVAGDWCGPWGAEGKV